MACVSARITRMEVVAGGASTGASLPFEAVFGSPGLAGAGFDNGLEAPLLLMLDQGTTGHDRSGTRRSLQPQPSYRLVWSSVPHVRCISLRHLLQFPARWPASKL